MSSPSHTDARLILLSPQDNCLIAGARLEAGTELEIEGERVTLAKTIELGHKVARGEHLHTHNLESDYLPTYTHDAGHEFVHH